MVTIRDPVIMVYVAVNIQIFKTTGGHTEEEKPKTEPWGTYMYMETLVKEKSLQMWPRRIERWEDNGDDFQREGKNSEVSHTVGTMLVTGE